MGRCALRLLSILAVTFAIGIAGCGSNDNGSVFEDCGNGALDKGEQCDDGNLEDEDACLSTCMINVCGDGFVNPGVEACDLGAGSKQCSDFGFFTGTLACSASCEFDTSDCSGVAGATPTPQPTPSGEPGAGTPTATSGGSPGTPTATPTPGTGATCQDGQALIVTVSLDQTYAGFAISLGYPASVLIPGTGAAVGERVTFAVSDGITTVSDQDDVGDDGIDDTLRASFLSTVNQDAGAVLTVVLDCLAGATRPSPADFTCAVSASTSAGDAIPDIGCSLSVQ